MCFREGINPNLFGDLGAYCGGRRLAGGFAGGASARTSPKATCATLEFVTFNGMPCASTKEVPAIFFASAPFSA